MPNLFQHLSFKRQIPKQVRSDGATFETLHDTILFGLPLFFGTAQLYTHAVHLSRNNKMKYFAILLLLIAFIWIGCDDLEKDEPLEMLFEETQCDNPWEALPGRDNYLFDVRNYLHTQGLTIWAIASERIGDAEACDGCNCLSGNVIIIRIPESQMAIAEAIGFQLLE